VNVAYPFSQLDALLRASIAFADEHGPQFWAANLDLPDLGADIPSVTRMLDWVAETDKGLIESLGFGFDNIRYFRLGHYARPLMEEGGFATYVRRKTRAERLERVRSWAPMVISLIAVTVSILSWQTPKGSSKRLDDLALQVNVLRSDGERTSASVASMRAALDTMSVRVARRH